VVGDTLYGAPRHERVGSELLPSLDRNFLHAARVAFVHPRTALRIEVRAPLPPELARYLAALGRAAQADPASIDAVLREFL
jgi:23S rRNA pseudouridine1911/1915/1917 synthase